MLNTLQRLFLRSHGPITRQQYLIGLTVLYLLFIMEYIMMGWSLGTVSLQARFFGSEGLAEITMKTRFWTLFLGMGFPARFFLFLGSLLLMRKIYQQPWKWILLGILGFLGLQSVTSLAFRWGMARGPEMDTFMEASLLPNSILLPFLVVGLASLVVPFFVLPKAEQKGFRGKALSPTGFAIGFWTMVLLWCTGAWVFIGITDIRTEAWAEEELLFPAGIQLLFYVVLLVLAILRLRNAGRSLAWGLLGLVPPLLLAGQYLFVYSFGTSWLAVNLSVLFSLLMNVCLLALLALPLLPEKGTTPEPELDSFHA